jgi:hypothetical protein
MGSEGQSTGNAHAVNALGIKPRSGGNLISGAVEGETFLLANSGRMQLIGIGIPKQPLKESGLAGDVGRPSKFPGAQGLY